jgi:hypothetical protein
MTEPLSGHAEPDELEQLLELWLRTQLLVRACGQTIDLDEVPADPWPAPVARIRPPITLVTGWNPGGRDVEAERNRAANKALRRALETRGLPWRPALGRATDGSWAEPGFAVGGLDEEAAAALGREWGQLAVYMIKPAEVVVLASDRSFRRARPRGRRGAKAASRS